MPSLARCYTPRPSASVGNNLLDLQTSSYPTQSRLLNIPSTQTMYCLSIFSPVLKISIQKKNYTEEQSKNCKYTEKNIFWFTLEKKQCSAKCRYVLEFSKLPIFRAKSRFPPNSTLAFLDYPISETDFCFPWGFERSGFHCGYIIKQLKPSTY